MPILRDPKSKISINLSLIFLIGKTFIFDMDETLIHCHDDHSLPSDIILPMEFPNGDKI